MWKKFFIDAILEIIMHSSFKSKFWLIQLKVVEKGFMKMFIPNCTSKYYVYTMPTESKNNNKIDDGI